MTHSGSRPSDEPPLSCRKILGSQNINCTKPLRGRENIARDSCNGYQFRISLVCPSWKGTMRRFFVLLLLVSLAVGGSIVEALATEIVHFESAQYRLGALAARRAAEDKIPRPPAPTINGYLVKPNASGPFPAIVLLHGCDGLSEPFKSDPAMGIPTGRLGLRGSRR